MIFMNVSLSYAARLVYIYIFMCDKISNLLFAHSISYLLVSFLCFHSSKWINKNKIKKRIAIWSSITKGQKAAYILVSFGVFGIHSMTNNSKRRHFFVRPFDFILYICILWFMDLILRVLLRLSVFTVYDNDSNLDIRPTA